MSAPSNSTVVAPRAGTRPTLLARRQFEDNEFLAPALEVLETPPSPICIALMSVICAFVTVFLAWSYLGQIDIVVTAQGKIQPVGRVNIVQPLEDGKVIRILATNGSHVVRGQPLIELDPGEVEAEVRIAELGLASTRAEVMRRTVAIAAAKYDQLYAVPPIYWTDDIPTVLRQRENRVLSSDLAQLAGNVASLDAQRLQKQAERDQLAATAATQQQLIATLQQRVDMRSALIEANAGTKASLIDATETLQYQITQLALQKGQLISSEKGTVVLEKQKEKARIDFASDNTQKMSDGERKIGELEQSLAEAEAKRERMTLTSPSSGIVQASTVTNPGQVLTTGQEVMRIIPDGVALETEVYVLNRDIGSVKVGQDAIVKVEAFPFIRYGVIRAHVTHVAADAIPEPDAGESEGDPIRPSNSFGFAGAQRTQNLVFAVRLSLDSPSFKVEGHEVPLTSGMAVTADFQTGRRRILEYLFSPMIEVNSEAMREP